MVTVKPICPELLCKGPPSTACKIIPGVVSPTTGCTSCPTYSCPVDCSQTACLAVVVECDASKGQVLKKADGITTCCDTCVPATPTNCLPPPCAAPKQGCKATPGPLDARGCPTCPSYDCTAICPLKPCALPDVPPGCTTVDGGLDAAGCPNCPTVKCPSKCDGVACPQYFAACETTGKVTQKADPANGICCDTCVDPKPTCDCRSQEQKDCEAKGGSWSTKLLPGLPEPLPLPPKQKRQIVAACLCAQPLPGFCIAGCSCPDPVAECTKSGGKWVPTIDPSQAQPEPGPGAVPPTEPKPVPGPGLLPPTDTKQKRCSCAAPSGVCMKPEPNPCALVKCASPNCGANQKIVTKPGECCPTCQTIGDCLPVKCPLLAARSNCRQPLPVADAKGVCPTLCLCTEIVKLKITPTDMITVETLTDKIKSVTGATDVTVVKMGSSFEVTVKGDTTINENSTNSQQAFADATSSKLTASGSLGQVAVIPNDVVTDAAASSSASLVSIASFAVVLLAAAML